MTDRETRHSCFAMFHPLDADRYLCYLEDKRLQPRDFAVLYAMMSFCDTKTGRVRFSVLYMAKRLCTSASNVSTSLSRLKKVFAIAQLKDSKGVFFYMINPYLFSVGSRQKWGLLLKQFISVFNDEEGKEINTIASDVQLMDPDGFDEDYL